MATAVGWLTLALTLIVTPVATAADGRSLQLLPPPEFDHPYTGELTVVVVRSQQEVRDLCPRGKFGPVLGALACSALLPGKCRIVLGPEEDTKAAGVPAYVIWRHEIAHCNGWPEDHRGARFYEEEGKEWAEGPGPKAPKLNPLSELLFGDSYGGTSVVPMPSRHCGIAIQVPCD